jgi:hypothetical protein
MARHDPFGIEPKRFGNSLQFHSGSSIPARKSSLNSILLSTGQKK